MAAVLSVLNLAYLTNTVPGFYDTDCVISWTACTSTAEEPSGEQPLYIERMITRISAFRTKNRPECENV